MNQKQLTWLVEKLQSPDVIERRSAIEQLAKIQTREAIEPLLQGLADSDFPVRRMAARALQDVGDERAIASLITCVQNEEAGDHVRAEAARALGKWGGGRAVEPLITCLQRSGEEWHRTQAMAAQVLGHLGDHRAVQPLITCLQGGGGEEAARALGRLGDHQAVKPLVAFFQESYQYHEAALLALIELGEVERVRELLLSALQSPIRMWVIKALGQWGDVHALIPLLSCLHDPEPLNKGWAALAILALSKRLEEREEGGDGLESEVQRRMEEAQGGDLLIGALGPSLDPRALKPFYLPYGTELLLPYLYNQQVETRTTAAWALALLGDARATEPLLACLEYWQTCLQRERRSVQDRLNYVKTRSQCGRIIHAFGILGDARAVEPLLASLDQARQTHERRIAEIAVTSLGWLRDARAVEPLLVYLEDEWDWPGREVGAETATALGELGDGRAVEPLCRRLQDREPRVRLAAIRALQKVGDERAVEPLIMSLDDPTPSLSNPLVATEAARALGLLRDIRALEPLRTLLHRQESSSVPVQDWHLVQAAKEAIFRLEWAKIHNG